MRGVAAADESEASLRTSRRYPSSVAFGDTFSRKGRRESEPGVFPSGMATRRNPPANGAVY
jgi:hypothetical protein